jgi:hypothetical protein
MWQNFIFSVLTFSNLGWQVFDINSSKTNSNWAFQALGVSTNDFSWSGAAWSIYQSLFRLENYNLLMGKQLKCWSRKSCFFKNVWKLCQKMRLDALIIFLIEWRHKTLISRGKHSKYWCQQIDIKAKKMRRDALIIFLIEWRHKTLISRGKHPKYWSQQIDVKAKKMRRDALIIFLIEWRHKTLISRGKHPKYWSRKMYVKAKKMRRDALIIFLIEWRHKELILRGERSKYWRQKSNKLGGWPDPFA